MQEVNCAEGARIWFNLDEMGLHGWADVLAVEPCPHIQSGSGRVVIATVTHFNSFVMEVRLAGVAEVLQPTDRHRLFSVTRNDWVPVAQLTVGEELATKTGFVRVESVTAKPGTHRVYNIEVETEHCFYAGAAQVLSHNNNPCAAAAQKVTGKWLSPKEYVSEAKGELYEKLKSTLRNAEQGQHGVIDKRVGNQLIQQANELEKRGALPEIIEQMRTEGQRLINKGGINFT